MKRVLSTSIVVCLGLLFHGYISLLSAGNVTLEISTTTGLEGYNIAANFRITNRGTDTAQEVAFTGKFLQEQQSTFIAERIKPGQSAKGCYIQPMGKSPGLISPLHTVPYQLQQL